jgi:hypothetical protein
MSAQKIINETVKQHELCNIQELLTEKKWNYVLLRLDSLKAYIPNVDRKAILETKDAPPWLRLAAFMCKGIPSC